MSADDQTFLDTLSSVPNDIRKYSSDVADYVDSHLEHVSNVLREALSSSKWIPESARPKPLPSRRPIPPTPASSYHQVYSWVVKNRVLTAGIVVAVGGLTYYIIRRNIGRKKRRARRASNGARLEVVVIAGQPAEPSTRSLSLDLERRGFIVYVTCNTIEEEILVQNESRPDIKPLMLDIAETESAKSSIERFTTHLQTPHLAFSGAKPHHLSLRSLIVIPPSTYPSGPIATISPSTYWDLLHSRLLSPLVTIQLFLPLLQSLPFEHPSHHISTAPTTTSIPRPSVLLLTPSIISSLNPPFHAPESTLTTALTSLTNTLRAELSPLSIPVTHLQLGTFDFSALTTSHFHRQQATLNSQRAETLRWDDSTRQCYGRNYVESTRRGFGRAGKGSSLRELNDAVFDAMVSQRGGVVRVGVGAGLYAFVGNWVPGSVVSWMMGLRGQGRRSERSTGLDEGRGIMVRSRGTSPGSSGIGGAGGNGNGNGLEGLGESDYIAVHDRGFEHEERRTEEFNEN